jgi:hypothetical protein
MMTIDCDIITVIVVKWNAEQKKHTTAEQQRLLWEHRTQIRCNNRRCFPTPILNYDWLMINKRRTYVTMSCWKWFSDNFCERDLLSVFEKKVAIFNRSCFVLQVSFQSSIRLNSFDINYLWVMGSLRVNEIQYSRRSNLVFERTLCVCVYFILSNIAIWY